MDKNNQYVQPMTKPLPYGWIEKMKTPSLSEFNHILLSSFSHEDKIRLLFVVDIKFHDCYLTKYSRSFLKKINLLKPTNA